MIENIAEYIAYPSIIFIALYVFVFILWLFATDFYDFISDVINIDSGLTFFTAFFIFSIGNFFVSKFMIGWNNIINFVLNGTILIVFLFYLSVVFYVLCSEFNKYCKKKRGKL